MYSVTLRNIRGVKELQFPFPEQKGVYVLTGTNGCGKTSLMVALNRIGSPWAFSAFPVAIHGNSIDTYQNASVEYSTSTDSVSYLHRQIRWIPSPYSRKNNIFSQFPFKQTLFVSASSNRFFSQSTIVKPRQRLFNATQETKDAMNGILDTTRFTDLQYYIVNRLRGRKKNYYRSDKLYFINNGGVKYSESNFSFGERLLLNTLDALENIQPHTLLLIDEVELALHPIAQVRLYDYLAKQAKDKDLAVIISTHSSTLIRHATNRYFLEKGSNGIVNVLKNCYPAYILKQVAGQEDQQCDAYFFVEDEMARKYFRSILKRFRYENSLVHIYSVEPVGTYDAVIRFVQNIDSMGIPKQKSQAVIDADAKDTYQSLLDKGNDRMPGDDKKLKLFQENNTNISYLPITPELGIWEWLEQHKQIFNDYFMSKHGESLVNIIDCIDKTTADERKNKSEEATPAQLRNWAKGCVKNFKERINQLERSVSEENVVDDMIECYVENTYNNDMFKAMIMPIINR